MNSKDDECHRATGTGADGCGQVSTKFENDDPVPKITEAQFAPPGESHDGPDTWKMCRGKGTTSACRKSFKGKTDSQTAGDRVKPCLHGHRFLDDSNRRVLNRDDR